jgi:hypothetical protein
VRLPSTVMRVTRSGEALQPSFSAGWNFTLANTLRNLDLIFARQWTLA